MKILAIGSTSYVGAHGVRLFSDQKHQIDVLTRDPSRVQEMDTWEGVRLVQGDPTQIGQLSSLMEAGRYDACVNYMMSWGDHPSEFLLNDTLPQLQIAETAAANQIPRYVFTSSVAAYGDYQHEMEETQFRPNTDNYGASKASIERFLLAFARNNKMRINICRPGIIFGESPVNGIPAGGQPLMQIVEKVREGTLQTFQRRQGAQLIHARDLARCYLAFLHSDLTGEIVHTLGKPHIEFEAFARTAADVLHKPCPLAIEEGPDSDHPKAFTVEKLQTLLGLRFDPRPQLETYIASL